MTTHNTPEVPVLDSFRDEHYKRMDAENLQYSIDCNRKMKKENELTLLIEKRNEIEKQIMELIPKVTNRYSGKGCEPPGEDDK